MNSPVRTVIYRRFFGDGIIGQAAAVFGLLPRRYDSALLLAAKAHMDVAPPIVDAASLEAQLIGPTSVNRASNFHFCQAYQVTL